MAKNALAKLIQVVEYKDPGSGEIVRVPIDEIENKVANQILASRLRGAIEKSLSRFHSDEVTLTPKELNDLANAAAKIVEFSGAVYSGGSGLAEKEEKKVTEEASVSTVDFSKLGIKPEPPK